MSRQQFPPPGTFAQQVLRQRIVVDHIHRPRMLPQTLLQIRDHSPQS